jgi:DNA-binding transcriptional LysR family regulator
LTPQQGYFLSRTDHPLLERPETTVKDVLQFPLAMASNIPSRVMGPFLRDLPKSSLKPHLALITDNLDIIREVISGTDLIGVFALSQVEAELEKRTLAVIPCTVDWLHSQYGLITLKRHTGSPDKEAFIRLALEADEKIKRKEKELAQKYLGIG